MITGTRYRLTLEVNRQMQLAKDIQRAMTEISTAKKIQAPSDDPVGAARVSDIARLQADMATWKTNLDMAAAISQRADDALGSVSAALARVKELMLSAANGTLSQDNREIVALELRGIAEEIAATQDLRDSRGDLLFPVGGALRIPVSEGILISAVATRSAVFDITTAGGPKDLVAIINDAADAILEPDATRIASTASALDEIDAAVSHIAKAHGEQGMRGNRIDNLVERLAEFQLQSEEERSKIESADLTEVITRLQSRQLTLQAAQAAFARINSSTLFDLLR